MVSLRKNIELVLHIYRKFQLGRKLCVEMLNYDATICLFWYRLRCFIIGVQKRIKQVNIIIPPENKNPKLFICRKLFVKFNLQITAANRTHFPFSVTPK